MLADWVRERKAPRGVARASELCETASGLRVYLLSLRNRSFSMGKFRESSFYAWNNFEYLRSAWS